MVADTKTPADTPLDGSFDTGLLTGRDSVWWPRLTSAPALAAALVVVTALAAGPAQELDRLLAERWLLRLGPSSVPFVQNVLDRMASQLVCLPVLATVAIVLARRRRSCRPVVVALLAEAAFLLCVGTMKVLFARGASSEGDPRFLEGGLLDMGTAGIAFPSGHAAEAVLVYGTAVHLIAYYSSASQRLVRVLCGVVVAISVNSVASSFLLGWHWMSDLIGGLLAGGLFLRLLVDWDVRSRPRTDNLAREPRLATTA